MKIEKLYTLSQFVDSQRAFVLNKTKIHSPKDVKSNNVDKFNDENLFAYGRILKYNEFLKQPITKDMFVNEFEYPDESLIGRFATYEEHNEFDNALEQWQQAEKKVLFKSIKPVLGVSNDLFINPKSKKPFRDIAIEDYDSLQDLAEATNGELKLKNVEM